MRRLERVQVNPTVGILEQIADTLGGRISEFLVEPARGEARPKPLRGGGDEWREIVSRLAEALRVNPAE